MLNLNKKQVFDDALYNSVMQLHYPLYQYIVTNYRNEIWDGNLASIAVFGDYSLPLAIELSQFRYPVTYIAKDLPELEAAKKSNEKMGGHLIHDAFWFDYTQNIPRVHIALFVDVLENMVSDNRIYTYIDLLLRRCGEIVCSVKSTLNWRSILEPFYDINIMPYPNKERLVLRIREKASHPENST